MKTTEQTEAEIAAWAERNGIYPLSAARLAFEDAATSDYAKQQAVNERCALLEQLDGAYAKAAQIDKEVRRLSVLVDSLACHLNPNKEP